MKSLLLDYFFLGAMALFAAIVIGLQVYGGAYSAEFTGHADEAAHFVSALLVRDYMSVWPPPDPLPWAMQYYIHYPKVAIGHWPPGYYGLLALWWLVFPIGRASALWLNVAMTLAGMAIFYVLARRIRPGWPTVAVGILFVLTPVVQESNAAVLADLPSLLAALLFLWTLTRLLEEPRTRRILEVTAAFAGAIAIKGTAVALLAAPVLAVGVSGLGRHLRLKRVGVILAAAAVLVTGLLAWQYRGSIQEIRMWAGLTSHIPWRIDLLPELTGLGCLALAVGGIGITLHRRQPVTVAAAAVLISMAATSYYVRAIREPRHWIAAVPALLLLTLAAYSWLEERCIQQRWPRLAPLTCGLVILFWFPFHVYRQEPEGFRALAAQLRLPARMLVSSTVGWSEGSWIAIVALGETRPQSTVVRGTKLLASTDWNGKKYRLLAKTREDIERSLDETAIDIVILHNSPAGEPGWMQHHPLLHSYVGTSPAWRFCAHSGSLEAYCRTAPPRHPRKPLRIDLGSRLGQDAIEQETPSGPPKE